VTSVVKENELPLRRRRKGVCVYRVIDGVIGQSKELRLAMVREFDGIRQARRFLQCEDCIRTHVLDAGVESAEFLITGDAFSYELVPLRSDALESDVRNAVLTRSRKIYYDATTLKWLPDPKDYEVLPYDQGTWLVRRRGGEGVDVVDLDYGDGTSVCTCADYQFRKNPDNRVVGDAASRRERTCKHIRLVHFLKRPGAPQREGVTDGPVSEREQRNLNT
jgi:hypothetical protein